MSSPPDVDELGLSVPDEPPNAHTRSPRVAPDLPNEVLELIFKELAPPKGAEPHDDADLLDGYRNALAKLRRVCRRIHPIAKRLRTKHFQATSTSPISTSGRTARLQVKFQLRDMRDM